ncbi:MAG: hypothetical protein B6A08_04370 [Sorangiineae bacterium NIC37A_2]|nr:MAG: hypothetical protein B6A08_04370 [Sorangiineae bacterium NIC37A_2]
MREWRRYSIRQLVGAPISGKRPTGGVNAESEGIPSLGGENIRADGGMDYGTINRVPVEFFRSMPKGRLQANDVLINKDGAQTGKVGLYDGRFDEAAVNEHVFILRSSSGAIDQRLLYYFLLLPDTQLRIARRITGSAQPGLNSQFADAVHLTVPSERGEQRRIAEVLSTVDEAIEQTEALIAKTQQIKAGLMHDLFTRGVTADGQLRPPREEAPQLYKESPLGWIPKDWETFVLDGSDIAIIDGDRGEHYPQSHELLSYGHCLFLSATNVTKRGFEFSSKQFITRNKDAKLRTGKLVRGDVIITTRGTVGNIAYYDDAVPFSHVRINSGMVILRSSHPTLLPDFLYASLQQHIFDREYKRVVSGSAQPQLPIRDLKRFNLLLPHADEQGRILARVAAIHDQIASESETRSKLCELKHGLMHDLLTGRVPVTIESAPETKEVAANV